MALDGQAEVMLAIHRLVLYEREVVACMGAFPSLEAPSAPTSQSPLQNLVLASAGLVASLSVALYMALALVVVLVVPA